MTDRIAGARRRPDDTVSEGADPMDMAAASRPSRQQHTGAQLAADSLESMASRCETFFVVLTFLGYIGAAILIALGVTKHFSLVPGIALAIALTASLLPMLMLCRWAQAYAVDLSMRSGGRL
jgi:hypothetical protein